MRIGDAPLRDVARQLADGGIGLALGPYEFRIESAMRPIVHAVHTLHAHHPLRPAAEFSDFRLRLEPGFSRLTPSVVASVNGQVWHTWPRRLTVAAMEWICSWCFFRGAHRALAVHAAAAALPGVPGVPALPGGSGAIVFPGNSGSGKSTLASTLMLSGWDLLSDEIAHFDLDDLRLTALARPTILKGHSLRMMAERFPGSAVLGPRGRMLDPPQAIAHLRPTESSVRANGKKYTAAALVFPCREAGAEPELKPITPGESFALVTQFGINYRTHGEAGFNAVLELVRRCPAFRLRYEDAADAERLLRSDARLVEACRGDSDTIGNVRSVSSTAGGSDEPKPHRQDHPDKLLIGASGIRPSGFLPEVDSCRLDDGSPLSWLIDGLRDPGRLARLSLPQWDLVVPLAENTELLPRLAHGIVARPEWGALPERLRQRLSQSIDSSEFTRTGILFELRQLERILSSVSDRIVLLKGAAYLQADFPWARGRRTSDVDLLVPSEILAKVESTLADADYSVRSDLSRKDDLYYRRWLHEIAPMRHPHRLVEVDIHFRLLPIFDPLSFPVDDEIARSIPLPGTSFRILDPVDRVLHAIINLARTGAFSRGLRDLWDIDCMIRTDESFDWDELVMRVKSHHLETPVADVLLLLEETYGLTLPADVAAGLSTTDARSRRRRWLYRVMRYATVPTPTAVRCRGRRFALWAMEHYPPPRARAWLDPLTWTKRVRWMRD